MAETAPASTRSNDDPFALIRAEDSLLCIIDVQDTFLHRLDEHDSKRLVENICWVLRTAKWLNVPILVTAEDVTNDGPTIAKIRALLPPDCRDLDKQIFGLADQDDILDDVARTGRRTAILVGMETDVCVLHSALGLAGRGYRVAVVVDATASPRGGHPVGIDRLRAAGITLVSAKSLFFEWIPTLAGCKAFFADQCIRVPEDLPWA